MEKVKNILLDDWSEYDNLKLRNNKEVYYVDFNPHSALEKKYDFCIYNF